LEGGGIGGRPLLVHRKLLKDGRVDTAIRGGRGLKKKRITLEPRPMGGSKQTIRTGKENKPINYRGASSSRATEESKAGSEEGRRNIGL